MCRKWGKQAGAGYAWQEGDIQWTQRNSVVYPAVSSLAGLVAGMFGVGGGIVKVGCGVSILLPVSMLYVDNIPAGVSWLEKVNARRLTRLLLESAEVA